MKAKRNGGRGLLSSIFGLALLLVTGWSPRAAPLLQTPIATLRLINDSEQTICFVFISPVAASDWGEDRLGRDDTVLPGETATFDLTPGDYDVLLLDCDWNALLQEYGLPIAAQYDLRFSGRPIEDALMDEAVALYQQADFRGALERLQQALPLYRQAGDRQGEATALYIIGSVYYNLSDYEQALDIVREIGDRVVEAATLTGIGLVYHALSDYEQALAYYRQALPIREEIGDRAGEATTLHNIGGVYHYLSDHEQALAYLQRALAISRKVGDRTGEGTALANIGSVYRHQGRYEEALAAHEQALAIYREAGNRAGEGATLNGIGVVHRHQGRYEEALAVYEQALTVRREAGDRAGEGTTLSNIGVAHHDLSDYEQELTYYQQALPIQQEIGHRAGEAATLNNIGGVYYGLSNYEQALAYFQQALPIQREIGDRAGEGNTLTNIGSVYDKQGHYAKALDHYRQAMDVFETVRATAGSEEGRAGFIARYAGLYARAVALFHRQGRDEDAFFTAERGRARAFLDSLATGHVQLSDSAAAGLLARERQAYAARLVALDALARARALDPPDGKLVSDLEAQLTGAKTAHAEALAAIEARRDRLASLVPGRGIQHVLSVPDAQEELDEETALLSYYLLEDRTLAFLITQDRFEVFELDVSREELINRVVHFRDLIALAVEAGQPGATRGAAQELYQALIAPLAATLDTPNLAIVPHGVLHYLPFAALLDPETGQYLLERYTLVTLPSASVLPFIQQDSHLPESSELSGRSALVIGNPAAGDWDLTASPPVERGGPKPLPFAEQEARAVAALYGVEPLIGQAATEGAVRERAGGAGILHLAAHGVYNPAAPLNSLLALAPDELYDGWLTAGEVYGLDLARADLVVLSACQTHLGELSAGDEVVGLTRAFLYAGMPTLVATLWSVDDEASALLMERFYIHLRQGMGKAEALRQAQIEVLADYPEPYYWAAFVLSGEGGEPTARLSEGDEETGSEGAKGIPWGWLMAGVGVLAVVIVGGVLWRRRAN